MIDDLLFLSTAQQLDARAMLTGPTPRKRVVVAKPQPPHSKSSVCFLVFRYTVLVGLPLKVGRIVFVEVQVAGLHPGEARLTVRC